MALRSWRKLRQQDLFVNGWWGVGVNAEGCGCMKVAADMDQNGAQWCRDNFGALESLIVQNAKAHKWMRFAPFKRLGVRALLLKAISIAEDKYEAENPYCRDPRSTCRVHAADGREVHLNGLYQGASAFLVCSGPSLKTMDLWKLKNPGCVVMSVNNPAAMVRSHLWVCVDRPDKFIEQFWLDPAIMKFVPMTALTRRFADKTDRDSIAERLRIPPQRQVRCVDVSD